MTDRPIPESIRKLATSILDNASDAPTDDAADIIIARALMARDERAARIARQYAQFEPDNDHGLGYLRACDSIATAILSEGE